MLNLQKERDGLSWYGSTWVGKMVRDDSGTGWKRDGLSRIPSKLVDLTDYTPVEGGLYNTYFYIKVITKDVSTSIVYFRPLHFDTV